MIRVSALKLHVFGTCRLRYRYQYLEKGVRARLRPSDTAGSLVHRVLCDFYAKVPAQERSAELLVTMFEDGWLSLSPRYLHIKGVERYREAAVRQLTNYTEMFDYLTEPYLVEPYFQAEIEPGVLLFGRLDRVDTAPEGSLHIIDYKTGVMPGDVDPEQLRVYAILVEAGTERRVLAASFWYLDDGSIWTVEFTEGDKARARTAVLARVREMEQVQTFPPTIAPHCAGCPFLAVCECREQIDARRESEGW